MSDTPLAQVMQYDAAKGRAVVTFKGNQVPPGLCAKVIKQLAIVEPSWLQVLCDWASPGPALSQALTGQPLPSVKVFAFDTHFQTIERQSENSLGDLGQVFAALPQVERVFATGSSTLSAVTHAHLQQLFLLGAPLPTAVLTGLGSSTLPALETLGLNLGSDIPAASDQEVLRTLATLKAPTLRSVYLAGSFEVTTFLGWLGGALPGPWSTLSLDGRVQDEDALVDVLKAHAPALRGLTKLGLPLSELTQESVDTIMEVLPATVDCEDLRGLMLPATYLSW